jgi:hypothetical protein
MVAAAACSASALTTPDRPSFDDVEAAYLYNFGKFVRWPASADHGPLLICVAGKDPFGKTVAGLITGERINDRPLQMRNLDRPDEVQGCSILFVGAVESQRQAGFLAAAEGKPVLTVGNSPDFLVRGGMIQFVFNENHVRFTVSLNATNRSGLGLSSELLKVAVSVTGGPGKEEAQ